MCISFLPKADCNSASQFSALLSLTLGRCLTACSHPCHTQPDTSGQGQVYGDEGSLLSVSYPLLPCSYLDSSGVNPCSPHQKHGICTSLSLTKGINWHLSYFTYQPCTPKEMYWQLKVKINQKTQTTSQNKTSNKRKTSRKHKPTLHCTVSSPLLDHLTPGPEITRKDKLAIKTSVSVCEQSRMGWDPLFCQGVGQYSLRMHSCFHQYTYLNPYFHIHCLNSLKKGHYRTAFCSYPSPELVLNHVCSHRADPVEAHGWSITGWLRSYGTKVENLQKQK